MNYSQQEYIFIGLAILFGSAVHATAQLKISREKKTDFTLVDFVILFVIASFAGVVFGLVASMFTSNIIQIILSAAIGSFLGMVGLVKVANTILDVIVSRAGSGNNLSSNVDKTNDNNN